MGGGGGNSRSRCTGRRGYGGSGGYISVKATFEAGTVLTISIGDVGESVSTQQSVDEEPWGNGVIVGTIHASTGYTGGTSSVVSSSKTVYAYGGLGGTTICRSESFPGGDPRDEEFNGANGTYSQSGFTLLGTGINTDDIGRVKITFLTRKYNIYYIKGETNY